MLKKVPVPLACLSMLLVISGCENGLLTFKWKLGKEKVDVEKGFVEAQMEGLTESLAYRDTIAEQGWIEGLRLMRVRGYGIVAGLGTRGSSECPENIRAELIQEMYKHREFSSVRLKPAPITPAQFIDDLDTAVVTVEGEIPAAAPKGTTFDVTVRALPGTQTVSLEGGRLYTAELHMYRDTQTGRAVEGKALAKAAGAIFVNPFRGDSPGDGDAIASTAAATAAPVEQIREASVIGGGVSTEPRRLRFVLTQPSYQMVQRIASTINARFPGSQKVAEATSPSYVSLRVPAAYQDDPFRFLALVRHLYLPKTTGFPDQRARDLAKEILDASAPHADIALAWEGIGRTILPKVQELYTNERPHVSFYAALAGLRMGDDVAAEVLGAVAIDPNSPYRLTAIEELGRAKLSIRAALILRQLLDDDDPRVRVEAYEALLARMDRIIETTMVGGDDFALDKVPSTAENLIYVRRTGKPRIALLGSNHRCTPPVFYESSHGLLTINADKGSPTLTLVRRSPFASRVSPPLEASPDVAELIAMLGDDPQAQSATEVHGLAMDYSSITQAIYALCASRSVNAKFMLQSTSVTEMFGPLSPPGRSESDLELTGEVPTSAEDETSAIEP